MGRASSLRSRLITWSGPLLTLGLVTLTTLLSRSGHSLGVLVMLLPLAVGYSTYVGGVWPGFVSCLIVLLNVAVATGIFDPTMREPRDFWLLMVVLILDVGIVMIVGGLRHRAEGEHQRAEDAIQRATALEEVARERARAAEALQALEASVARTRAIFEASLDAILALDIDGRITEFNAAAEKLFGHAHSAVKGTKMASLLVADQDAKALTEAIRAAASSETSLTSTSFEVRGRRADGREFPAEVSIRHIEPASGSACVCFVRDLAAQREAENAALNLRRAAAESEKLAALGVLVSGVAHEIRTPLAYIQNNIFLMDIRLERARKEGKLPEDMTEFVRASVEGVERITKIVNTLKAYTRLDAGERTEESLDRVVAEAVVLFRATHGGQVGLDADLAPTPPTRVNRLQVQQVVLNLLENGAEAMRGRGRLRIATAPACGGGSVLVVRDDGPGIPADVRSHIYDPFFTTKKTGTGLGLSIVKRIVDEHDASITCSSEEGAGTSFEVTFPPAEASVLYQRT